MPKMENAASKSYAHARETTEKALNAYIENDEKDERQTRVCWDSGFSSERGCDSSSGWTDLF
jgi:hypothetical protein